MKGTFKKRPRSESIPTRGNDDPVVLSYAQRQMWVIDQMQPGTPAYNLPVGYRLKGHLDVRVLENSFNEVIKRHEILRTTFAVKDNEPVQVIHPELEVKINSIGLEKLPKSEREIQVQKLASEEAIKSFDLSNLPLVRITLYKLEENEHILLINVHHIVADGWSVGLLFKELDTLYRGFATGRATTLPELQIQYADYALWQRQRLLESPYQDQFAYWQNQLEGPLPILELPSDKPRLPVQSFIGSNEFFFIPKSLTRDLHALALKNGCTLFMNLLAAFQVLLHRYSGLEDIIVGTPIANRSRSEIEQLIGNFINMIALRVDLSGNPSFIELLSRVKELTLNAFSNQDLPFEKIIENLRFRRDPSRNAIFQVMLQISPKVAAQLGDLEVSSFQFNTNFAQLDLSLHLYEEVDGLRGRFEYDTDLFSADTIERLSLHFQQLLKGIVNNPEKEISELPILLETERKQILLEWNNTSVDYPKNKCLHELFEQQVEKTGRRVAVEYDGKTLTYDELNSRANQLANYLSKFGVKPDTFVGICVDRSLDMVVGLLGILKSGAAYVPMDPSFPPDRLSYMLEDANISVLVTQEYLLNIFPGSDRQAICIDKDWERIKNESVENLGVEIDPSALAYTIYTSGSTGKPKGVMIEHGAVVNFLTSMQNEPGLTIDDILVAVTTISFDIAVLELFLPLVVGAKVVLASKTEASDGNLLLGLIDRAKATTMQATPSSWKIMIEVGWGKNPTLKMLCGGEALPRDLANKMLERGGGLWNMYGPTETTIWSSVKKIEQGGDSILIGPPIANTQFYIVDKKMKPVPIGVAGELLIGGDGLARGYLNRPELTEERFIKNLFEESASRLYRTGDLARFRANGDVEFLGRLDFQVKLRGFRIELGEIEYILAQHENVKAAVVLALEDKNLDKRLVAYIIPLNEKEIGVSDLRNFLAEKLPGYMIPSLFVKMNEFPLTANGKIDRKAFPEPDTSKLESAAKYVAPRDELELQLAAIWQKALKVKQIGIHDNFFELGGHSLLAAQLFAQIGKRLGKNLPLAILFESPTIGQLAQVLKQKDWKPNWRSLVPIKVIGRRPPLFLIHGAEGNVLLYKNLAYYLGADQPVYGLQSQGLTDDEPLQPDIKKMAEDYIKEMKSVQPEGPYYLGGYCLGGTIAFEIAQQLTQAGDEVSLIAMFETYNIREKPGTIPLFLKLTHKFQNAYFHIRNLILSKSGGSYKYFKEKASVELSRYKVKISILYSRVASKLNINHGLKYQHLLIDKVNDQAQADYMPSKYGGKITLFKPKANYAGFSDPYFGWGKLAEKGVEIVDMPVYPRGTLNEPFVQILADRLRKEVDEANKCSDSV